MIQMNRRQLESPSCRSWVAAPPPFWIYKYWTPENCNIRYKMVRPGTMYVICRCFQTSTNKYDQRSIDFRMSDHSHVCILNDKFDFLFVLCCRYLFHCDPTEEDVFLDERVYVSPVLPVGLVVVTIWFWIKFVPHWINLLWCNVYNDTLFSLYIYVLYRVETCNGWLQRYSSQLEAATTNQPIVIYLCIFYRTFSAHTLTYSMSFFFQFQFLFSPAKKVIHRQFHKNKNTEKQEKICKIILIASMALEKKEKVRDLYDDLALVV